MEPEIEMTEAMLNLRSRLYARHVGRLRGDELEDLDDDIRRKGLTQSQCKAMVDEVLAVKAARKAAAEKETIFSGTGTVLVQPTFTDVFLRYGDPGAGGIGVIDEHLQADGKPLQLDRLRVHRHHSYAKDEFEYLCEVAMQIHRGELVMGQVFYVAFNNEKLSPLVTGLRTLDPDFPLLGFEPERWQFIRRRGQSERAFNKALAVLKENCAKQQGVSGDRPAMGRRW